MFGFEVVFVGTGEQYQLFHRMGLNQFWKNIVIFQTVELGSYFYVSGVSIVAMDFNQGHHGEFEPGKV